MPDSAGNVAQGVRRGLKQLGPQRMVVAAVLLALALYLALNSWKLPLLGDAERALYDIRATSFAPATDPDQRVTLVVYTADTNRKTGKISPVDRSILAKALAQIDAMGAKGVGIDILFDSPQVEDAELLGVVHGMKTPVFLAYADNKTNPEAITWEQEQDLRRFIATAKTTVVQPASILLETDADGVARYWPRQYAGLPPLLSLALTNRTGDADPQFAGYRGRIRYRTPTSVDRPVFDKIPIDMLADPDLAPLIADKVQGRYLLIGGDFSDFDQFYTPFSRTGNAVTGETRMIGVEVHASMLAQLLDKAMPATVPGWAKLIGALVAVGLGVATALARTRTWVLALAVIAQFAGFLVFPFVVERAGFDTLGFPATGWVVGWLVAFTAVSSALRAINAAQREFAQGALGKYLPRSIASEIMRNPERLSLHGEKREIFCLFSDLEGFTKLTHAVAPEMIARLLNDYLDRLSAVVLEHGGTLDKFVGDAVVAFWGAPLSKPDDGERAVKAARAMYLAGEEFRRNVPEGVPPIGRTRVGLHFGEAIVGNFGGEGRIQYTALGDAMNTAARLESANKPLDTTVLVSREAMERSGLDWFRPMGRVTLRGRAQPVEVFEPVPDASDEAKALAGEIVAAHDAGDAAAVRRLTARIDEIAQSDLALKNLAGRLAQTEEGESHVLG
ncbi:adenylate/guanylate cyclase domain-containing protein [Novosphingobium cyanobacteriorum]|uniref:Adenylate/guanylate cyclase domain-containing protein n=1 Tax=Novosphingobium cyanobacteriorum TaxID=3024215 RepID=A0ABT6CEF0_9SPHN|nr:adenylate/guanylate cyclase domain-containing protein [Novosphingobium cyanobacteriorum]MDF8332302.1 adenylate/guanylate cyclase domain-containing protein [Novosphingobium cyanobacteriorum]